MTTPRAASADSKGLAREACQTLTDPPRSAPASMKPPEGLS